MVSKETLILLAKLSMIAVTLLGLTACRSVMRASDIYIAQNATGANNGQDCSDAYATSFFNNGGNWGSGAPIGPGTTVHLCGTITSELTVQGSGSSGNAIEVLFQPGASIQISPGCDSNGCVNLGSNSYIVLDGGRPCGWNTAKNISEGTCNGRIENMLYGSSGAACPGGPCITQPGSSVGNLIQGSGGNGIEIRNLELGPSYVHTATGNGGNDTGGTECVLLKNGSNWNLHDNKAHDGVWCIVLVYTSGAQSNWTIANNELYNNSHMTAVAGASGSTLTGFTMSGNYTHDMANWDTSSDADHANALHSYGDSSTSASNFTIKDNIMGGHMGQNATSQVFLEAQNSKLTNLSLYNNLMYNADSSSTAAERLLFVNVCMSGCEIYNNTLVGPNTNWGWCAEIGANGSTDTAIDRFENNVMSNCSTLIQAQTASFGSIDYNAYGLAGSWVWGSTFVTYSQWKSDAGEGSHTTDDPSGISLGANFVPSTGSPLIAGGLDMSSVGMTGGSPDLYGQARLTSWDVGAIQHPTGTGPSAPAPPTALVATTH